MPVLVTGISFRKFEMAGTSPAMTHEKETHQQT